MRARSARSISFMIVDLLVLIIAAALVGVTHGEVGNPSALINCSKYSNRVRSICISFCKGCAITPSPPPLLTPNTALDATYPATTA
ncbi:hypothetical protein [Adonisia turfae]|uniref:hypothetical protein n=1 Tax=Adonisia turfae TaxID=2950184 RepID=UPI002029AC28|nr:hypothetical protein [Adonisia turfae]